ncbi:hypothetical protein ACSBR1_025667 [Camellia fascicularis]
MGYVLRVRMASFFAGAAAASFVGIRTGPYRNYIARVSDSSRYVSGIGRYGREIHSHRYTGEYPTWHSTFLVRTGRYGTYRPIFRTLTSTLRLNFFFGGGPQTRHKIKLDLSMITQTNGVTFLPRQVAQMNHFSSNKFLKILNRFLIKPNSVEAEIIKETIKGCERSSFQREQKYCATSLESMIDFCTSMFGQNIQAFSTELKKLQEYRISGFKKIGRGG